MMRFNNMKMLAAAVMASACAFVSCVEMEQQESAVGYLDAPSLEVDVAIEDMTQTKAPDIVISAPSPSEIHYVVKDKDGNVKYDEDGLWTEPLVLPVGAYTVDATYGSNGFGAAYFTGTVSGTIAPLDKDMPALTLSLANSLLCIEVDPEFASHFDVGSSKAVLKSGSSSADVSYGEWIYVPSGADLEVTMSGTTAGKPVSLTHTLSNPSPKAAYNMICRKDSDNWPKITMNEIDASNAWASRAYVTNGAKFSNISEANQKAVVYEAIPTSSSDWSAPVTAVNENGSIVFKGLTTDVTYQARAKVGNIVSDNVVEFTPSVDGLSVSAAHTYTSNELDGTDVQTTFSKSDLVKNAISSWTVNICKSDGTVLRSERSIGNSDGSALTGTADWPYLPVGDYKVTLSATMADGEVVIVPDALDFSVAAPTFTVTASGKTTYDYAQARDLNSANAVSGSRTANASVPSQSLFEIGSSVSIASNLMDNTNYSKTVYYAAYKDNVVVVATDGYVDYGTSNTHSLGDVHDTFSDWRSYLLSAKVNFAGTEYEGTRDFHITGLPYTAAPPKNSGNHPWTEDQRGWGVVYFEWNDTEFVTWNTSGSGKTNIIGSPSFHVPSDISVGITLYAHGRYVSTWPGYEYDVRTKVHAGGNSVEFTADGSDNDYDKHDISSLSLTSNDSKVQIENTHVSGTNNRLHLQSVSVYYR